MANVILVTGPSAAGKTTAVTQFLKRVKGVWAYVGQDDVHGLIKAGYKSANGMRETWDKETEDQWQTSIEVSCDLIRSFHNKNINCIVDFFAPPEEFKLWEKLLGPIHYQLIVILPDLQTVIERNNQKSGTAYLSEEKIKICHQEFKEQSYSISINEISTSGDDLESVVNQLLKFAN